MEMGPVLVVSFQAQQIAYIGDANGKVIEGDPVCYSFIWFFRKNYFFIFFFEII